MSIGSSRNLGSTAVGHAAVGYNVSTSDDLSGAPALAMTGWDREPAAWRLVRMCQDEGLTQSVEGALSASELMGPMGGTATFTELLQECVASDGGIIYEDRTRPGIKFRCLPKLYRQKPKWTLNAAANDITHPFAPAKDDQAVRNDVTLSRRNGLAVRLADEEHVRRHGRYDTTQELSLAEDGQVEGIVGQALLLGTWPGLRYPSVTPALTAKPELIRAWLSMRPGDVMEVVNLPPQHPTDAVGLMLQGYVERFNPDGTMEATANTSAAGPWNVGQLGDKPGGLALADDVETGPYRADSAASSVSLPVDEDDVSVNVIRTAGAVQWITTAEFPDHFPFRVMAGGEEWRVLAVVNTANPLVQTFTVDRSVNGIRKPHAAGTSVRLATPMIVAR